MFDESSRRRLLYFFQIALNSVVGYFFARLLAYKFGVSAEKDSFDIAYSVPFIILNVSGFAYLHSVITTHFAVMRVKKTSTEINTLFSTLLTWMLLLGLLFIIATATYAESLAAILAPGLPASTLAQTKNLLLLFLPLAISLGSGTYIGAVLTAYNVPITGELCQISSRLGIIFLAVVCQCNMNLVEITLGLVVCSIFGLISLLIILYQKTPVRYRLTLDWKDEGFQLIVHQGLGFLVCSISAQIAMCYMRRLASLDDIGTNSALTYGFAIVLPLSLLIGKPLALTVGPDFANLIASNNVKNACLLLCRASIQVLAIGICTSTVCSLFSKQLVAIMFGGGKFDAEAVATTATLSIILCWALPAALLRWVIVMPSLATRNSSLPGYIFSIGSVTHLVLTPILFEIYGRNGLAIAYTISVNVQALIGVLFVAIEVYAVTKNSVDDQSQHCKLVKTPS